MKPEVENRMKTATCFNTIWMKTDGDRVEGRRSRVHDGKYRPGHWRPIGRKERPAGPVLCFIYIWEPGFRRGNKDLRDRPGSHGVSHWDILQGNDCLGLTPQPGRRVQDKLLFTATRWKRQWDKEGDKKNKKQKTHRPEPSTDLDLDLDLDDKSWSSPAKIWYRKDKSHNRIQICFRMTVNDRRSDCGGLRRPPGSNVS